jgi:hypothetical protein
MRPPRWEYTTVKLDIPGFFGPKLNPGEVDAQLNALGREGWELVSALDLTEGHGHSKQIVCILKRSRD